MLIPKFYPVAQKALYEGSHDVFDLTGYIPQMLSLLDPRPAVEQLNENYAHGGGWHDFQGFTLVPGDEPKLTYPGDPPTHAIAYWELRDELIILFENSWVAVVQPNGSYRISRMD